MNRKLTVLMTVRNGLPYIKDAVDSILNQTYHEYDFLIIDNASNDGTDNYLETITDIRVKIVSYNKIGFVDSINHGLEKINTKYIATVDADDFAKKTKLEKQIEFLDQNPQIGIVGTYLKYFVDLHGRKWKIKLPVEHDDILAGLLSKKYVLSHPTTMLRTDLLKQVGGLREKYPYAPDLDMFLRLSQITRLANIPEYLYECRISPESITGKYLRTIVVQQRETIEEFSDKQNKGFLRNYLPDRMNYYALSLYKKGLYKYLDNSKIIWLLFIITSGIIHPCKAYNHLTQKLTR